VSLYPKFLDHLVSFRGRTDKTAKVYEQTLKEAFLYITVDSAQQQVNLMPYRLEIAHQQPRTIAKKLSALRSYFEWLKEMGYRFRLKGIDAIKTPKSLPKPLSDQQIRAALEEAAGEDRLILWMLYGLGLRIAELSSLRLDAITEGWARIEGKGGKTRTVPILPGLQTLIEAHIQTHQPKTFLFEKKQTRLSENQLRYRLSRLFKKVGLTVTPHQLRHAFATELLNGGARIADVSELLGHTQLGTTEIYTKLAGSTKLQHYLSSHPLCKGGDES
jgi:integrase/recombinase XerC